MKSVVLFCLLLFLPLSGFSFQWVIVQYKSGDWYNARPSVMNLLKELEKRTTIEVDHKIPELSLEDERIFEYSFLFLNGHVPVVMNSKEKDFLRRYILNGGFLFINDDYGIDKSVREILSEVFPDYPLQDIPYNHPIYHSLYDFPAGLPKIHEHDGGAPRGMGIVINSRVCVFYAFNADIADGWDDESVHNDPMEKREQALRMGINIVIYALSH